LRPFASVLLTIPCLLIGLSALSATAEAGRCDAGSADDRVDCLKARICPDAEGDAELANCYRAVAIELAGGRPAAEAAPGKSPVAASPVAPPTNVYAPARLPTEAAPAPPAKPPAVVAPVAPAPSSAPAAQTAATAQPAAEPAPAADDFGLPAETVKAKKKKEPKSTSGVIVMLERQTSGSFLIGLDNGQLWEENEPTRVVLEEGQSVKITRGLMGSYKLIPDRGRSTGVHRLRCTGDEPDARCALLAGTGSEAP